MKVDDNNEFPAWESHSSTLHPFLSFGLFVLSFSLYLYLSWLSYVWTLSIANKDTHESHPKCVHHENDFFFHSNFLPLFSCFLRLLILFSLSLSLFSPFLSFSFLFFHSFSPSFSFATSFFTHNLMIVRSPPPTIFTVTNVWFPFHINSCTYDFDSLFIYSLSISLYLCFVFFPFLCLLFLPCRIVSSWNFAFLFYMKTFTSLSTLPPLSSPFLFLSLSLSLLLSYFLSLAWWWCSSFCRHKSFG